MISLGQASNECRSTYDHGCWEHKSWHLHNDISQYLDITKILDSGNVPDKIYLLKYIIPYALKMESFTSSEKKNLIAKVKILEKFTELSVQSRAYIQDDGCLTVGFAARRLREEYLGSNSH